MLLLIKQIVSYIYLPTPIRMNFIHCAAQALSYKTSYTQTSGVVVCSSLGLLASRYCNLLHLFLRYFDKEELYLNLAQNLKKTACDGKGKP